MRIITTAFALLLFFTTTFAQNPWNGKVFLQGFWWDYWNANYPNGWYNYLAELAPRLRDIGIDAVWLPPSTKAGGTGSVGYDPFDPYDLGDKYQKGTTKTRLGDKNEYLRMIAVMHANGIDVYQDVVVNHLTHAETEDPEGWDNKYKNFRYVCYETNTVTNYSDRKGRWPKNWKNFHPNPAHNCNSGDFCSDWWGPDICYWENAFGVSSNTSYNPNQSANYMRDQARAWLIWLKKQTGIDGFRFDAVKHFPYDVAEDFLWNLQHNSGFASGGEEMFAAGEIIDNTYNMDNWCNAVMNRAGTFDFSFRGALKNMTASLGAYDLSNIPGSQQGNRTRTVPFVNNHDTFRPTKDANGNYTGWDTYNETGGHVEPYDPRIAAAYAAALSVDGNPCVFFEDLFNVGNTSKRYAHLPTNTTDLPQFGDIAKLIHLYKQLDFKGGAYQVPHQSGDHLIIERAGKAIIGISDHWDTWQSNWITSTFPPGTQLIDYAGSSDPTDIRTVHADQRINISTPPCNGSAKRKGYSVWGPVGIPDFTPVSKTTTQEWELADDLGDSHTSSLQQGGQLPAGSTDFRTAGKIFAEAGKAFTVLLHPDDPADDLTLTLANCDGSGVIEEVSGSGDLTLNHTPLATDWFTLKARNTNQTNAGHKVWIQATYTAPQVVNTAAYPSEGSNCMTTVETNQATTPQEISLYPNPGNGQVYLHVNNVGPAQVRVIDALGQQVFESTLPVSNGQAGLLDLSNQQSGLYFIRLTYDGHTCFKKLVLN